MRWPSILLAAFAPSAAGCALSVDDDVSWSGEPATRGDVAVERIVSVTPGAEQAQVRTHVSARFMQLSGGVEPELAELIVGRPRELPALGSCDWREPPPAVQPLPEQATEGCIELLDVGEVLLRAGEAWLPLAARAFPDVGELVSGVVYTSRDSSSDLPLGVPYSIETSGSPLVGSFRLTVDAPAEPWDFRVDGEALDSDALFVVRGEPIELEWVPTGALSGDQLYVDLQPTASTETEPLPPVRCSLDDTGLARVTPDYVDGAGRPTELELVVHRTRRVVVRLPEIDETMVEFDFAVAARLPVVEPE